MTAKDILAVLNYDAGMCLCGHNESCSVCSRNASALTFELLAKRAAAQLAKKQGLKLKRVRGILLHSKWAEAK